MTDLIFTSIPKEEIVTLKDLDAFKKEIVQLFQQSSPKPKNKNLITSAEAAEKLKISEVTLWKRRKRGEISWSRIGRRILFDEDLIEQEIKQIKLKRA